MPAEIAASSDGDVADRRRGNESSVREVNATHEMLNLLARRIRALREEERRDDALRRSPGTMRSRGLACASSRELRAYAVGGRFTTDEQRAAMLRQARDSMAEMPIESAEEPISTCDGVNVLADRIRPFCAYDDRQEDGAGE